MSLESLVKKETVSRVTCDKCGRKHVDTDRSFMAVYGNITIGLQGGVVGNNLQEREVQKVSIFCRPKCMLEVLYLDEVYEDKTSRDDLGEIKMFGK